MDRMTKAAWKYFSDFNANMFVAGEYVVIKIGFDGETSAQSAAKSALEA